MMRRCESEGVWQHSLTTCWEVAQQCGLDKYIEAAEFKKKVCLAMVDKQMILVRRTAATKRQRNSELTSQRITHSPLTMAFCAVLRVQQGANGTFKFDKNLM